MLSGIRTGKKKKKRKEPPPASVDGGGGEQARKKPSASHSSASANQAAADALRAQLLGGGGAAGGTGSTLTSSSSARATTSTNSGTGNDDVLSRLESRGKIVAADGHDDDNNDNDAVVLTSDAARTLQRSQYRKEDFRHGSRKGKMSKNDHDLTKSREMTIADMVAEEKRGGAGGAGAGAGAGISMDEQYARNIARVGSRYKGTEFATGHGSSLGADEVDYSGIEGGADMSMFQHPSSKLTDVERAKRDRERQVALHDKESSATARCWWWMESSRFEKHRLLALGNHVSLILCPSNLALVADSCYLVPIRHAESFVSCEDEVWDEVQRFKTSLRKMFAKQGMGVLFCETVLPSKNLWQARMDVVPVPKRVEQDAAMYFKSALTEQAEEWGTHTKLLSTRDRGVRRTVPKGFPYFNVEWDNGGFAQIIESSAFPKDFGLDTIAGMMQLDPVRFNRKTRAADGDRAAVLDFCKRWKEFDWTLELD